MIIIIDGINASKFGGLLEQTYALRARVFQDRLGWDVRVQDGLEFDEYDSMMPTQVVSVTDDGDVVGCMRLLQTMGPNMLADVFHAILQGEPAPRSPDIWEATRFCVDTTLLTGKGRARNSISFVTSEIMVGAFEYARAAGVRDAVAVIDPVMNRVLCRSGNAPYDYLGKPTNMGKVTAMAALMDCSQERIDRVKDFAGLTGDVFLPEDEAIARFGDTETTETTKDLTAMDILKSKLENVAETSKATQADLSTTEDVKTYIADLLANAKTDEEKAATLELLTQLQEAKVL